MHESMHNWLNSCFLARKIELPPQAKYYSPWRKTYRPAYGILHAALAFSSVYNFLRFLITEQVLHDEPLALEFCANMLEKQHVHLASIDDDVNDALSHIHDRDLIAVFVDELKRTDIYGESIPGQALLKEV